MPRNVSKPRSASVSGADVQVKPVQERARWYACYTMARREKRVDAQFAARGIERYLPLVARERQWHDRRKIVELPLLPGYIFARFELHGLMDILTTPGVASVVHVEQRLVPIADEEIANIALLAGRITASDDDLPRVRFQSGQRVRITGGQFDGVEGVVLDRHGGQRVLVGIRTLGLAFELNVNSSILTPLADSVAA